MLKLWMLLAFCWLSIPARAEFAIEAGPTFLSDNPGEGYLVMVSETLSPKWKVGLVYVSEQRCRGCTHKLDLAANIGINGTRIVQRKRLKLGIGATYFQNTNRALSKNFNFHLTAGFQLTRRISINVWHWSNAGSGITNLGQDALTLSWAFR